MRSIFQSTNVKLTNAEHFINIIDLHKQEIKCQKNKTKKIDIEQIMETYGFVDYDGIDINQHEHMKNVIDNLSNHQFLSFNHQSKMINEYNNHTLLSCMFPSLFPFRIGFCEMTNRPIKISLQTCILNIS